MLTRRQALQAGTAAAVAITPAARAQNAGPVQLASFPDLVLPPDQASIDYAQFPDGALRAANPHAIVTGNVLRKALAWSSIDIRRLGPVVLFGLRGADLVNAEQFENGALRDAFVIRDTRPDHVNLRCTLGVWRTATDTFFAARGSTVAHVTYLERQCEASMLGHAPPRIANQMPTGVYRYGVGTHQNMEPSRQPGAFKLDDTIATVRNLTGASLVPTRFHSWEVGGQETGNNIHAGEGRAGIRGRETPEGFAYLSAGCQVVEGDYDARRTIPTGPWRNFRVAAGLKPDPVILRTHPRFRTTCVETDEDSQRVCHYGDPKPGAGTAFSYVLLTGAELRLAVQNQHLPHSSEAFARIRKGSSGPRVAGLLRAMGLPPSEAFGAQAQHHLIQRWQQPAGRGADGQITPDEARRLGLEITW